MISKLDFVFAVGYQGDTAIVDGKNKKLYSKYSSLELADSGLFKPAVCSALYDRSESDQKKIVELYNSKTNSHLNSIEDLMKVYGIFGVPDQISKVKVL